MKSLGPYTLEETVGTGGMCDVWRATGPEGETVAVKVLRSEFSSDLLHDEIHLMTSLSHPGIVAIHAWGDATRSESEKLSVAVGTPWVAMDFADRGSLTMDRIDSYAEFRRLALAVLDALMHSHARGVIHRDLKPGNILVHGEAPRYMLSDFGIAFPKSRAREGTYEVPLAAAGTTNYIAPEQLIGRWRDFNSYTDLFSLGVVLFELATGVLPFPGTSRIDVAMAHQSAITWPEETRFLVPDGFAEWLRTLLARDPSARFAFAADAAHALLELGSPAETLRTKSANAAGFDDAPTIPDAWGTTLLLEPSSTASTIPATIHIGGPGPPVPTDWRPHWWDDDVPRESERDWLWSQLCGVIETSRGRAVVIRGRPGLGANRLARWLCERAHEVGAADDVIVARRHGASALADTIRHVLRLGGLDGRDRMERLSELLGDVDLDREIVSQLALGLPLGLEDQVYVVTRILEHFSKRRPLIIWLQEENEDLELLEIVRRLSTASFPVLLLLTAADEQQLPMRDPASELQLGPLSDAQLGSLVRSQFTLEPAVVEELVRAAEGNPLHAVRHAGLLAAGGEFERGGLFAVWGRVVNVAIQAEERSALLAAAVLGMSVHIDLWRRLCRRRNIAFAGLTDRFIQTGLWTATTEGYAFVHATLRDALLNDPSSAEQIRDLHAEAVTLFNPRFAAVASLRAGHMIAAADYLQGAHVAYQAVLAALSEARTEHARGVTASFARALDREDLPVGHPTRRWATLMHAHQQYVCGATKSACGALDELSGASEVTLAAEALRCRSVFEGHPEQALETAHRALALADDVAPFLLCSLHHQVGRSFLGLGRALEALPHFERAAKIDHDPISQIAARIGWGRTLTALDRSDEARDVLSGTVERACEVGVRLYRAQALSALGDAERRCGDLEAARRAYTEVLRLVHRASPELRDATRSKLAELPA